MSLNVKCPKCGSEKVQLSDVKRGHGCLFLILFSWLYLLYRFFKAMIGVCVFLLLDWWLAIIFAIKHKQYFWKCRKFFSGKRKYYYCHDCGHNFKV